MTDSPDLRADVGKHDPVEAVEAAPGVASRAATSEVGPLDDEERIRAEISTALAADQSVLGEVYRGVRDGLTDEQIQLNRGNERPNFVWNYKRLIRALIDGDLPSAPTVASQAASKFRKLLRTVDFTPETRLRLQERLQVLESRVADADAQAAEDQQALAATEAAETSGEPGIYVYTLPHYIRYPYDTERQHTLLKIGHSGSSVIERFNSQRRETVLPEEPVLLRVYPTAEDASAQMERQFHDALTAADHLRREGRVVGREWFLTTTKFLDHIAAMLGLEVRIVFDPANLE
jgi:hypothetical protein